MNYYAVIVAGGTGNRMKNSIPKQFLLLNGRPVMMYAIEVFYTCPQHPKIIVVLHEDVREYWLSLCKQYNFTIPHLLVNSGPQRFHSVKNGLAEIQGDGIVAIHDAARPLVSEEVVCKSFDFALENGNCVVGITPVDSVRTFYPKGNSTALKRDELRLVQTPQTFQVDELKEAYKVEYNIDFTDDASVMEAYGVAINVTEGNRENIKITYPEDLDIATIFLKRKRPMF
ncbi:MAG: 2-C-methyl-D-erythritol 4-phosphate cytidylyltransferase [Pedobacter sp.]